MIILLLVLALFGFTFAGTSSSTSGTTTVAPVPYLNATASSKAPGRACASRPGARAASGQARSGRRCRPYVPIQP